MAEFCLIVLPILPLPSLVVKQCCKQPPSETVCLPAVKSARPEDVAPLLLALRPMLLNPEAQQWGLRCLLSLADGHSDRASLVACLG